MVVISSAAYATQQRQRIMDGILFWGVAPILVLVCAAGIVAEHMRGGLFVCGPALVFFLCVALPGWIKAKPHGKYFTAAHWLTAAINITPLLALLWLIFSTRLEADPSTFVPLIVAGVAMLVLIPLRIAVGILSWRSNPGAISREDKFVTIAVVGFMVGLPLAIAAPFFYEYLTTGRLP